MNYLRKGLHVFAFILPGSSQSLVHGEHITKASSVAREVVNKETSYREGVVIIANH